MWFALRPAPSLLPDLRSLFEGKEEEEEEKEEEKEEEEEEEKCEEREGAAGGSSAMEATASAALRSPLFFTRLIRLLPAGSSKRKSGW